MSADPLTFFGPLLRRYREASGLTQEALASRAGLSTRAISDLERGVKRTPRQETLHLLLEALALSPHKRALLTAAARPLAAVSLVPPLADTPPHNLPTPLTPLIGRERESHAAADLLSHAETRLLTLTGPGGAGKTRLAIQVATDLLDRFDDGVCFVDLSSLRDSAMVMPALAQALALREDPTAPLASRLRSALREQQKLLLLDNFEHVTESAPDIVALLADCPRVNALVTSREALRVRGEHLMAVAPLAEDAAAELFLRRAREIAPELPVTPETLPIVAAICDRLDRLPLAIELAAAMARVLPLPALLDRLTSRLPLLTAGPRDLPQRQRTMRDAIAWSDDLLPPDEQRLFHSLAIFAGGCTLDAAESIFRATGVCAPEDTLPGLLMLVEKSLLRVEVEAADMPRFSMLQVIREYALERLRASRGAGHAPEADEAAETDTLGHQHAEYYATLAQDALIMGAGQDIRDQRAMAELDNIRAALAWARDHNEAELGLRLIAIARLWYMRGLLSEGQFWLRELLALDARAGDRAAPPAHRAMALYGATRFAMDRHDYTEAEALASEGLALARRVGDDEAMSNMLATLGHVAEAHGELDRAATLFAESLTYAERSGNTGALSRALSSLGNYARARGDLDRATTYMERALACARSIGMSWGIAYQLTGLGHLACERNDYARAKDLYRESLGLYRTLHNRATVAWCLEGVAVVAAAEEQHERVARLSGAIAALSAGAPDDHTTSPAWALYEHAPQRARAALGGGAFAAAEAAGRALSLDAAITYALAGLA